MKESIAHSHPPNVPCLLSRLNERRSRAYLSIYLRALVHPILYESAESVLDKKQNTLYRSGEGLPQLERLNRKAIMCVLSRGQTLIVWSS